jgi:Arc/MetJ family transcription regulator
MFSHMKTTLNIDDRVMARVKREAATRSCTMSELVETALRQLLEPPKKHRPLAPLPAYDGGRFLVDIDSRDALYQAMEEE